MAGIVVDAAAYRQQLKALLPPGRLWDSLNEPGKLFGQLLAARADELARVELRSEGLIKEADPRSAYELLFDWEVYAQPVGCGIELETLQQRRAGLVYKLTAEGGQHKQYYIDLAAYYGYIITIDTFKPCTVGMGVDQPMYGPEWRWVWRVNGAGAQHEYGTVVSGVNEPLSVWSDSLISCLIRRYSPGYTNVTFD